MRSLALLMIMIMSTLAGCGTSGVGEAGGSGDTGGGDLPGAVVSIQGRVALGTPVADAAVRALVHGEDGTWVEVSQALTNAGGVFTVEVPTERAHRPLRLTAKGAAAWYVEMSDGAVATLGEAGGLRVDLESASKHEGAVVHLTAWTTLAGCAADAYVQGHQVGGVVSWSEAMLLARLRIRDHLAGEHMLDLPTTAPSDLSLGQVPYPNPSTTVGLAAVGISGLVRFGDDEKGTSAELVRWLCRDLSDGLFDGIEAGEDGPRPLEAPPGLPVIDADTTRYALAARTHAFLGSPRDGCGLSAADLALPGGYYETISLDDGPLYPAEPDPIGFDPLPPLLAFTEESPAEGAPVSTPVVLTVTGTDPGGTVLVRFEGTEPGGVMPPDDVGTPDARALAVVPGDLGVQGDLRFDFSGTDPLGNITILSRTLFVDTVGPALGAVAPDPADCHESWSDPVILQVTDQGSGVDVVATAGGVPCSPSEGAEWACPPPPQGAGSVVYLATDAAGNTTEVEVWFCPDLDPPLVSFGAPGDLGFWGPAFPTISATISDPAGVIEWSISDDGSPVLPLSVDTPDANTVILTLPLPDEGDSLGWALSATDARGNAGVTPLTLVHDTAPPGYAEETVPGLPLGSAWKVSFRIEITDAQSGVAAVEVLSAGAWTVTDEGEGLLHIQGVPDLPPGGPGSVIPVDIEATDEVGNASQHAVEVISDEEPPVITWHTTGFVDETDCSVTPGDEGPSYSCAGAAVLLGPEGCAPSCPPIRKLATRLAYEGAGDIEANNLPSVKLEIHDVLPEQMEDPGGIYPVTLAWTFTRDGAALTGGEMLTSNLLGHVVKIPFASEYLFGVPPEQASFSTATIPDALEFVASDTAGNPTTLVIPLDIDILPPLLHVITVGGAGDNVPPSPLATAFEASDPAAITGAEDVEAVRLTLSNPSDLPVGISLVDPPGHRVQYAVGSAYLRGDPAAPICAPGSCLYAEGSPDPLGWDPADCQAPQVLDWSLVPEADAGVAMDFDDPEAVLEWDGPDAILPGGGAVDVVISVSLSDVPSVASGELTPVWIDGAWEEHDVHFFADEVEEWAFCGITPFNAGAFETSAALRLLRSRTPLAASSVAVARSNPQGDAIMTDILDLGWDRIHEATWPHIALPPDVSSGW